MSRFADVPRRLADVRARIARAGGRDVAVMAVTKSFDLAAVTAAVDAGVDLIGESYAQEVAAKFADARPAVPVHFIGQLQTNKVRTVAPFVDCFESVDRRSLVAEIAKRVPGAPVCIQIRPAAASGKGGVAIEDLDDLVEQVHAAGLTLRGLMTVGPTEGGPEAARPGFRAVRQACDRLGLEVCSMGMSDDVEVAVQEGSTCVRVGTALFGTRQAAAR